MANLAITDSTKIGKNEGVPDILLNEAFMADESENIRVRYGEYKSVKGRLPEIFDSLLDNPIGLLILIFVVPTLLKFGFGIIGAVFGFIADVVSGIFHIIYQILISPHTITKCLKGYQLLNPLYQQLPNLLLVESS